MVLLTQCSQKNAQAGNSDRLIMLANNDIGTIQRSRGGENRQGFQQKNRTSTSPFLRFRRFFSTQMLAKRLSISISTWRRSALIF